MLDLKYIREHLQEVRDGIRAKGLTVNLGSLLSLDEKRRALIQEGEALKSKRNQVSAEVGKLKREGKNAESVIGEMESVKARIQAIDAELRDVDEEIRGIMLTIPNLPHPSVPVGSSPADNKEVSVWGEPPQVDFPLKPHWELAERLGIVDFSRGGKIAGAGFPVY
ncbi:MAG: serine--tRNA ligase, partial [Ignavibacterium sp.]